MKQRERQLTLNYECLQTMPTGLHEVRVWWDPDLANWLVGKRVDLSEVEDGADLAEPQVMEMIDHPNVVKVRSVATVADFPPPMRVVEVLMPFYEEGSVTDALEAGKRFTPGQTLRIIRAALQGLAEMHERHGILHRDVKSPNLFLTGDAQTVKLGDLGLAGKMDADGKTPGVYAPQLYSPPELLTGDGLTRASDLYSLGVVLLELLRGKFDYDSYSRTGTVDALAKGESPLRKEDLVLPVWACRSLRKIVQKAVDPIPARRFQTAREMSDQLAKVKIADWSEAGTESWEAPFLCNSRMRVRVTMRPDRNGGFTLITQRRKTVSWRRVGSDVRVADLRHQQALAVFERANSLAVS
ncbi:serine/threonine-protein kinase [Streptomyces sp. NPDC056697]|uniref:serine/threonine-protein kinase n=1 Tax=Streptomyces sp. NPDC056697 TaxID=3345915 RepID=UPI0036D11A02